MTYPNHVEYNCDIEILENKARRGIITAALEYIPKHQGKIKRKEVPWWDDECLKSQ